MRACLPANKDESPQIITASNTGAVTYQISPTAAVEQPKQQTPTNIIGNLISAIIYRISYLM